MKMIFNDRQTDSADPQTLKITILVYGTLKDFHNSTKMAFKRFILIHPQLN